MRMIRAAILAMLLASSATAMPICGNGLRVTCVVDGDTVWIEREKIRLLGIDTPELSQPQCAQEALQAMEARDRLAQILDGRVTIEREGQDKYGRTLARLHTPDGEAGDILVREGFARAWTGRREPWCR